jgi:hypothetical protein
MKTRKFSLLLVFCFAFAIKGHAQGTVGRSGNIRMCNEFSGADAGAKIAACFADLPASGGIADARGLEGSQSATLTIAIPSNTTLLLGEIKLTSSAIGACITLGQYNSAIIGRVRGDHTSTFETETRFTGGTAIYCTANKILSYQGSPGIGGPTEANARIENLYLFGSDTAVYGVWLDRFAGTHISDVNVNKVTTDPFHFGDSIGDKHGSFILDAYNLYANGATLGANYHVKYASQVRCFNCKSDGNKHSVSIDNGMSEIEFIGGHLEGATESGVLIKGSAGAGIVFDGVQFVLSASALYGIDAQSLQAPLKITNSLFQGQNTPGSIGIYARGGSSYIITGNDLHNWKTGVSVTGGVGSLLASNIIDSSAGDSDYGVSISSDFVSLAGNTILSVGAKGISVRTTGDTTLVSSNILLSDFASISSTGPNTVFVGNKTNAAVIGVSTNQLNGNLSLNAGGVILDNGQPLWLKDNGGRERRVAVAQANTLIIGDVDSAGLATSLILGGTTIANLGNPANGTLKYCSDCRVANPCAGSGTGAIAKRLNGVWVCN